MRFHPAGSAIALALAGIAAPAMAQDARDTHFDGPYISGFLGMGAQGNDRNDTLVFDTNRDGQFGENVTAGGANAFVGFCGGQATSTAPANCIADSDRFEYGGRIGYDKRLSGNFVVGGLLELSRSESRDRTSGFSSTPASYTFERNLDYALSLRARAGYTPGGGALFYVTGGGSYAKINHRFSTSNTANSFTPVDANDRVWGWQAGGGGEIMLTNKLSLGLEYLYNRYDDDKYYVAVGPGTAPATNPFLLASGGTNMRPSDTQFDFHSLRATLSFQF